MRPLQASEIYKAEHEVPNKKILQEFLFFLHQKIHLDADDELRSFQFVKSMFWEICFFNMLMFT